MPNISINLNGINKLLSCAPDKAACPDEIRPNSLKELRSIHLLFEKSLASGMDENKCKPFFKKDDQCDHANYMPIPLTFILFKVMEHVMASDLTKHLNNHTVLFDLQHGFK